MALDNEGMSELERVVDMFREIGFNVLLLTGEKIISDEQDRSELADKPAAKKPLKLVRSKALATMDRILKESKLHILSTIKAIDAIDAVLIGKDTELNCVPDYLAERLLTIKKVLLQTRDELNAQDLRFQDTKAKIQAMKEEELELNHTPKPKTEAKLNLDGVTNINQDFSDDIGIPLPPLKDKSATALPAASGVSQGAPAVSYTTLFDATGNIVGVVVVHFSSPTRAVIEVVKNPLV